MNIPLRDSVVWLAVVTLLGGAGAASAQTPPATAPDPAVSPPWLVAAAERAATSLAVGADVQTAGVAGQDPDQPWWVAERRACEGCPPRSVGKAFLWATMVNVVYGSANLARGQVTGRITPKSWWANMQQGWVWDLDDFMVNQIGHPYQGNNYFNSGRSHGLSFYESAAVAAFGSATWEYFGETNYASLNDLINTTLGGAALGEMFHRAGWLVRNTHATGKARLWSEIGATALDPITGVNHFIRGDASRTFDKPEEFVPTSLTGNFSAGALWRGTNTEWVNSAGKPFLEMDLLYGDPWTGRSRTPYEAFLVRLRFGGGGGFSEARVRGRLLGEPFGRGQRGQFMVLQNYDFQSNDAFQYGAQSFAAMAAWTGTLTSRTRLWFGASGGLTVLGAVDSLPVDLEEKPEAPETPPSEGPGQGVAEGPRYYDYGPGSNFGGFVNLMRDGRTLVGFAYEGRHLYSLDGVRANHFLQQARLDLMVPIHKQLGIGATGEYLDRRTFYQDEDRTVKKYHYPQFRVYFTWGVS
jgi:hypothetical protein